MKKILLLFVFALSLSSCSDDEITDYTEQNETDIQNYLNDNNLSFNKTST